MTSAYPISQAAQRAGATVHQVRTYVTAGLVKPCATTAGGHFLFNEDCVARLRLIAAATRAGLRIGEIGVLVKALEGNNPRAVRAARRSVGKAIGTRQAAIQHLHALVAQTCGTAIPGRRGKALLGVSFHVPASNGKPANPKRAQHSIALSTAIASQRASRSPFE